MPPKFPLPKKGELGANGGGKVRGKLHKPTKRQIVAPAAGKFPIDFSK